MRPGALLVIGLPIESQKWSKDGQHFDDERQRALSRDQSTPMTDIAITPAFRPSEQPAVLQHQVPGRPSRQQRYSQVAIAVPNYACDEVNIETPRGNHCNCQLIGVVETEYNPVEVGDLEHLDQYRLREAE
jgi:hypothetical protein